MKPQEQVNMFSNPERGISPAELIDALKEIPNDVTLLCSKVLNINLVKDGAVVGRVELNNHVATSDSRLVADIPMLQETKSLVTKTDTGGAQVTFDQDTLVFGGMIDYYTAGADGNPPLSGNYVGAKITAPEGVIVDKTNATFTYVNALGERVTLVNGETPWLDGDDFVIYYPLVDGYRRVFEVEINWNPLLYKTEYFKITVSDEAILAPSQ